FRSNGAVSCVLTTTSAKTIVVRPQRTRPGWERVILAGPFALLRPTRYTTGSLPPHRGPLGPVDELRLIQGRHHVGQSLAQEVLRVGERLVADRWGNLLEDV